MARPLLLISLLLSGLLASASAQSPPNSTSPGAQQQGLHSLAVAAGKLFFGTATDTNFFNDTPYMQIVNDGRQFGILVPENSQKWQPTEPVQDEFVFANPDRVKSLARKNTQRFRCHTLAWFQQLPQFITTTQWTRDTLTAAIESHIANVVGHFKGAGGCYSWDVVNEALNDNGTFRNSVFFNTLGTDFILVSFRAAAAADPAAKLYYNDFNLEQGGNKTAAALGIVKLVQAAGLRIDGVGFQAHMTVGQTPSREAMAGVLSRFTTLGLEVALTELDVRMPRLPASAAMVQQQAVDYVSMVGACLDVAACVGVVVWEYTDRYSWIPSTFPGTGSACLFDQNLVPKPAYTSVSSLLAARATSVAAAAVGSDSSLGSQGADGDASVTAAGAASAAPDMTGASMSGMPMATNGLSGAAGGGFRGSGMAAVVFVVTVLFLC